MKREWAPEAGEIVWLTFDPQAGREQAGRRPALVLSPSLYNRKSGLALVCPITGHIKGLPAHRCSHQPSAISYPSKTHSQPSLPTADR